MTESIRYTAHQRTVSRHPYRFVALAVIAAVTLAGICGLAVWWMNGVSASPPSCATPAQNFVTLTTCKTQTARAVGASPTPTATRTPMPKVTPTRIMHNFIWCSSEPSVQRLGDSWFVECTR